MKCIDGWSLCTVSTVCVIKAWWNGAKDFLEDNVRPGQAHCVITSEMIAEVNTLVLDNRRNTMDEIHRLLGISVSTIHTIIHQHLNFRKVCEQWFSNQLTTEQRNTRIALSLSHLQRYHEGYGFLSQIVTGDETWGYHHHFEPESKRHSKQWKNVLLHQEIKGCAHQF
ncbi:histone-lysine N-methyltransferase SETMAR [Trichonephila clavipes]|nr:histone-lysine N-methyltransferase SETMAR [Trichonephila clavipes]